MEQNRKQFFEIRFSSVALMSIDSFVIMAVEHAGSDHIERISSADPVCQFRQAVEGLGVCVGNSVIEIGEDLITPVICCSRKDSKAGKRVYSYGILPKSETSLSLSSIFQIPNVIQLFLQGIGSSQIWKVTQPGIEDEFVFIFQVPASAQQQEAIMHHLLSLAGTQFCTNIFANPIERITRHTNEMELIHNDHCVREELTEHLFVRVPHIHADQLHSAPIGELIEVVGYGWLQPVSQQVDQLSVLDIAKNTTGSSIQFEFINPEDLWKNYLVFCIQSINILVENITDGFLVYSNLFGQGNERASQGMLLDVFTQAFSHSVLLNHSWKLLGDSLSAVLASISLLVRYDRYSLAVYGDVNEFPLHFTVTVQEHERTIWTTTDINSIFSMNDVLLISLFGFDNVPVLQVEDVYHSGSSYSIEPLSEVVGK